MRKDPSNRGGRPLILVILWGIVAVLAGYRGLYMPLTSPSIDFQVYWNATREILRGSSPYDEALFQLYHYPLFAGFLLLPIGLFPIKTACAIFHVVCLLLSAAAVVALGRGLKPDSATVAGDGPESAAGSGEGVGMQTGLGAEAASGAGINPEATVTDRARAVLTRYWMPAIALYVANYQPLYKVFLAGNLDPLSLLLTALFFVFLAKGRDAGAGLVLAVLTLVKLMPVLLAGPLFLLRRRRAVAVFAPILVAYGLFLVLSGYARTELFMYTDVLPGVTWERRPVIISMALLLGSLFPSLAAQTPREFTCQAVGIDVALLIVYLGVVFAWMRRRRRDAPPANGDLLLAFSLFMVLLMSPMLEIYHFVWVVPAVFVQARAWVERRLGDVGALVLVPAWIGLLLMVSINGLSLPGSLSVASHVPPALVAVYAAAASAFALFSPGRDVPS